jgi:O-succinylbenzoic acid--CoA ligase
MRFLEDASLASLVFFQDQKTQYTYKELVHSALHKASELKASGDDFYALKMQSPCVLFVHLLAGLIARKKMLILSHKEPLLSIARYQQDFKFTKILDDENSTLNFSPINQAVIPVILDEAIAFSILSSGSSGPSKMIPLSVSNIFHSARSLIDFFPMKEQEVSLLNLPHHHIGGLMILWRAFLSKGMVTTNPDLAFHFLSLVPLQLSRMMENTLGLEKLKEAKAILIGGAAMDEELKISAKKNNINVYETYGMSETCSLVMLNGRPLHNQSIKLDHQGHFLIKGPTLSPDAIRDSDGFYHTKDMGVENTDGSFSFIHRSDLLFKSAGELINPLALEALLKQLPWLNTAVLVPVAHPEWTHASALIYDLIDQNKDEKDILEFLKKSVHPHLIPKYFYKAPANLFFEGMKPNRFLISEWAQKKYFQDKIHSLYIPNKDASKLVVFFHGFMEDHTDFIPLVDSHKNYNYLLIDLPGHGKSLIGNSKSRVEIFTELKNLIHYYQKNQALILYGYSQGGRVALELSASLTPELLILESAHFGLNSIEEKNSRKELDKKLFENKSMSLSQFFNSWYDNPIFGNYKKSAHYHSDLEKKLTHPVEEWEKSLEFFSPGASPFLLADMLEKLAQQKIIGIVGSADSKYSLHFKMVKEHLKNFEYYTIDNSGHNPHKTHLTELKQILAKIL